MTDNLINFDNLPNFIDEMKHFYVSATSGLILLNDPKTLSYLLNNGYDLGSNVRLGKIDNSYYEGLNFWDAINYARGNPNYNLLFIATQFIMMISVIGDCLKKNNMYQQDIAELEFFRHIRNAVSHGNKFHFDKNEPRLPARFNNFIITKELNGQALLFEYISAGDLFDLFDCIKSFILTHAHSR